FILPSLPQYPFPPPSISHSLLKQLAYSRLQALGSVNRNIKAVKCLKISELKNIFIRNFTVKSVTELQKKGQAAKSKYLMLLPPHCCKDKRGSSCNLQKIDHSIFEYASIT